MSMVYTATGSDINTLRPYVLVGATPINLARHTVVVVPLSISAAAKPPITITVSCMDKTVTAICNQIRTVDKSRIKNQAGCLSLTDLSKLDDVLRQVLSF